MADAVSGMWVRKLPPNNFFNIERHPSAGPAGGGGALYIEAPSSVVPALLTLLGHDPADAVDGDIVINTHVVGQPAVTAPLVWSTKTGNRLRLFQNRQSGPTVRHPAWRSDRGFPAAPDAVRSTAEAALHIGEGLRVFVVRTAEGAFFAGFLVGSYPLDWPENPDLRTLFSGDGGVKFFDGGLYLEPGDQARPFIVEAGGAATSEGGVLAPPEDEATDPPPSETKTFPYASPGVAAEVDRVAMDLAMEWARETFGGAQIRRMPHNNPGYDIVVVEAGRVVRYIEVKGTKTSAPRFYMSETERRFADENAGQYTLIVFFNMDVEAETADHRAQEGAIARGDLQVVQWQGQLSPDG